MKSKKKLAILVLLVFIALGYLFRDKITQRFQPSTGQAVLSWSAGDDKTISGYKIYYGTSPRSNDCPPGGYAKNIKIGNKTKYTIGNLETGKTYYFSVTSYNSSGKESCFSAEMKKTVTTSFWSRIKSLLSFGKK